MEYTLFSAFTDFILFGVVFLIVLHLMSKYMGLEKSGLKKQIIPALLLSLLNSLKNVILFIVFEIEIIYVALLIFLIIVFLVLHFYYGEDIKKAIIMTIFFYSIYLLTIYAIFIVIIIIIILLLLIRRIV